MVRSPVVGFLCVNSGLRNQDKSVRNKVSSLFMTFIRNKKSEMYPYTQHLLAALKVCASTPHSPHPTA